MMHSAYRASQVAQLVKNLPAMQEKVKSVTVSTFSPSICPEVMGPDAMILVFLNNEFQASFFTLLFLIKRPFNRKESEK